MDAIVDFGRTIYRAAHPRFWAALAAAVALYGTVQAVSGGAA